MAALWVALMVVLGLAAPLGPAPEPGPGPEPEADPESLPLEQFVEAAVLERMEATGVPGVLVVVVRGDEVLLSAGYGLADIDRQIPMDAGQTIFRVASISKTVTATAVARLEDRGLVDLDAPVDSYLDGLALPSRYETPVTLRHLLNHTGGFINHNIGRVSRTPTDEPLVDFMARTMAPQVYPPGRVVLYSNHGNALAGLVVEQVAQVPFAEFVEQQILQPLAMDHSRFGALPPGQLATGYTIEDGQPREYEYLYVQTTPASALHTTGRDLARLMRFYLSDGSLDGQRVLSSAVMERMRAPVPAIDPALPGFHYAFAHGRVAGHPMRRHGGSVPGFLSRMVLFDEHRVGIFVGHNASGVKLRDELVNVIAERVLPEPPPPDEVSVVGDGRPVEPAALVGTYARASMKDTPGFTRAMTVLALPPFEVAVDSEGFLTVDGDRVLRTGPLVFHRVRESKPTQAVVFVRDDQGVVRWIHRDRQSGQRRPWHASLGVQATVHGLVVLILLAVAVGGRRLARESPEARSPLRLTVLAARLGLLGAIGPLVVAGWIDHGQPPLMRPLRFGVPWWLYPIRWLVPLAIALALWGAVRCWRASDRTLRSRALAVAVVLALVLWSLLELYWSTPAPGLVTL